MLPLAHRDRLIMLDGIKKSLAVPSIYKAFSRLMGRERPLLTMDGC